MRIAYLSIGGHIHTERWLNYFVHEGHDVHLITATPAPLPGVTVHDLRTGIPWKPLHYGIGVLRLRNILKRIRPDILHVHFLQGYGYWSIFAGHQPKVLTVWGDDVFEAPHKSRLRKLLSRLALKGADIVTGDSQDILREAERLGANRAKLHLILWGVDYERFRPANGIAFRRKWNISEVAPVVLSTRSFWKDYYNVDVILDAVPHILQRIPNAITVFAGYEGDDSVLRQRAMELGVSASVRFVGRIAHDELPTAMCAADVFVSVPSLDATAVSLLEAMACGRAIIVSDLPSNHEWIEHGDNGFIVPARDVEALVKHAVQLLESPALREQFGARCVPIARLRAGYFENMSRMESLCEDLVDQYRQRTTPT